MRDAYHAIIIGAGPGGLTAAERLAKHGMDVLLVEKNEVVGPKVCAGFLPFDERTEALYGPPDKLFGRMDIYVRDRRFQISQESPFLAVYSREKLGRQMLASTVRAGADVVTGALVKNISKSHVVVNGSPIGFKYLIGADGSNSIVRRKLGIPMSKTGTTFQYVMPEQSEQFELFIDYPIFGLGCGWVVPHAGHTLVGLGRDMDPRKIWPIGDQCRQWAQSRGWKVEDRPTQSWPISYDYRGWRFGNVFLIGDAGGFASGLTGEGIANAIISGREAARAILDKTYRPVELFRVLRRKEQHERLMRVIRLSPRMANSVLRLLLPPFKNGYPAERLVRFLF